MGFRLVCILIAVFWVWQLFGYLDRHPEALSKANLSRSGVLLGGLALLLIAFVALLVWRLK